MTNITGEKLGDGESVTSGLQISPREVPKKAPYPPPPRDLRISTVSVALSALALIPAKTAVSTKIVARRCS